MRIGALAQLPTATCRPWSSLEDAVRLMREHDAPFVPVTSNEQTLLGVLTERDVCWAAFAEAVPIARISVMRAMTCIVVACCDQDPIDDVYALMLQKRVHILPVLDAANRLVGLISVHELEQHVRRARVRDDAPPTESS